MLSYDAGKTKAENKAKKRNAASQQLAAKRRGRKRGKR